MPANWMPMRWPVVWRSASLVDLLRGAGIDCLIDNRPEIAEAASRAGVRVVREDQRPADVVEIEGVWPGIRSTRFGAAGVTGTGPTGEPWINSNAWPVRLAAARNPGKSVWVRTVPAKFGVTASPYIMAIADAALTGGRWILSLEDELAAGIANSDPECLQVWRQIAAVSAFFSAHRAWAEYPPEAVLGVLSAFSSSAEQEVLNLIARSGQQFRVLPKGGQGGPDLAGLRAVLYADPEAPPAKDRAAVLRFVAAGGLLIASPEWGSVAGAAKAAAEHPRFTMLTLEKGSVAVAKVPLADPYLLAGDCGILVSHRYDLLRFFNGGALQAYYSRGLVQIVFYANQPAVDTSMWIAGNHKSARLWAPDRAEPVALSLEPVRDGIELHLPGAMRYAAIEPGS
jgi:hypothetical protein